MVEIPAVLIANNQAAAGALEGHVTGNAAIAEPAAPRKVPLENRNPSRGGEGNETDPVQFGL